MVVITRGSHLLALVWLVLACTSCQRSPDIAKEGAEFSLLGSSLSSLSYDVRPLLTNGTVTNMDNLRALYSREYPKKPPLFTAVEMKSGIVRPSEYHLPLREYFWLRCWTTNDSGETPLFWSYFHLPKNVVDYLCIDGTEHACSSKEFQLLLAPLSNRIERAFLPDRISLQPSDAPR